MSTVSKSLIELRSTRFRSALSASGLVDGLVLHRVASEVLAENPTTAAEQDYLFAKKLIAREKLNPWQIEQLSEGRTKFTLGSYRIIDSIGRGGMGHVFKGEHELLGRFEAIKVLPRSKTTPEAIAGFRHEIRAQARLDHPNLVRVTYADRDGDTYFFVTEYVEGIDLRRLIRRRGAIKESLAALVVSQAAEAIDYAHRRGLVHRDVKPGNLLLTLDGRVKVTDLGLAWFLEEGETSGTPHDEKKVVGTSDYLAPESIHSPDRIVPVSDVYGLGCTLYYALTGKVLFPGGSHLEKLRRHLREIPTEVRRINPEVSDTMAKLVQQMLNKDQKKRIASAAMVSDTLDQLYNDKAKPELMKLVSQTSKEVKRRQERFFDSNSADLSTGDLTKKDSSTGDRSDSVRSDLVNEPELPETVGITLDASAGIKAARHYSLEHNSEALVEAGVSDHQDRSDHDGSRVLLRDSEEPSIADSKLDHYLKRFTITTCIITLVLIAWGVLKYLL